MNNHIHSEGTLSKKLPPKSSSRAWLPVVMRITDFLYKRKPGSDTERNSFWKRNFNYEANEI